MTVDPADSELNVTSYIDHPLYRSIEPQLRHGLPIAAHINGDTSWLLLIPYPKQRTEPANHTQYFKLVIDPWFCGFNEQGLVFSRLLYAEQHNIPSSVQTIVELEGVLRTIEEAEGRTANQPSPIDAVIVSNDNGDHCNEQTLRQLHPSVPVVALPLPFKIIQNYKHFTLGKIHAMRAFTSCIPAGAEPKASLWGLRAGSPSALDWRLATYPGLPEWLGLAWTSTPGEHPPFHTPLVIAFLEWQDDEVGRAIVYTPHCAPHSAIAPLHLATPRLSYLAIMAGLHRVWVKGLIRISEGARGGVEMMTELQPEYWLATHDEVKEATAKGLLIPPLLRRDQFQVADIAEFAKKAGFKGKITGAGEKGEAEDVKVLQLGSGEACTLGEVETEASAVKIAP